MSKISATVVGDSLSPQGHRLTSLLITFPRIILAELNTHRMLSKNTASSRAIPFVRMIESVKNNPFIPIAWQKAHSGMQGTDYFEDKKDIKELINNHLTARDYAISFAENLAALGATKQIANRYVEPFMWITALITGTEWDNFFELRCPQYTLGSPYEMTTISRSRKDLINAYRREGFNGTAGMLESYNNIEWLLTNKGQAEIHMMALAEAIWDARNESKPKQLEAGEWHIAFEDKIEDLPTMEAVGIKDDLNTTGIEIDFARVKIATSMGARTSYTVVGDEKEINYSKMIELHDRMVVAKPFHASPFEHSAKAMSDFQYASFIKGQLGQNQQNRDDSSMGWCRNFRGFIQYRHIIETVINV